MPDMLKTIAELFASQVFRVPDYQRGFAWEEKQWNDLLEDLELLAADRSHFTGTLVLHASENGGRKIFDIQGKAYAPHEIIDGQQRLTTVVILLKAIHTEMLALADFEYLAAGLQEMYLHHLDLNRQPFTKLTLNYDSQAFFSDHVLELRPGIAAPQIRSHQRLLQARQHFAAYLQKKRSELGELYPQWLQGLYFKILHQLTLIVYPVSDELDAGVIFETMNDRGKPLTELEKVKNYLLYLSAKLEVPAAHDLRQRINQVWQHIYERLMIAGLPGRQYEDQLLRSHWLMAYDYDPAHWENSRSVKNYFHLRKYQGRHIDLLHGLGDYLNSLQDAATAYCDVYAPARLEAFNDIQDGDLRRRVVLWSKKMGRLGPRAGFLPMLLAVRRQAGDGGKTYLQLLQLCEKFDFRVYQWLRARSTAGESTFYRLANQYYYSRNDTALLSELARLILYYCPDASFVARFDRPQENWYQWGGLTYFLYEYEHHLAGGRPVQLTWETLQARTKAQSIEHILPQTPVDGYWLDRFTPEQRARWTHNLGNLTLTYDNSSLSNRPFPEKQGQPGQVGRYAGSPLFIERELASCSEWTETQVEARRAAMRQWALDRWHVEAPAVLTEDGLPKAFTAARIQALAEQNGVGAELRQILDAIKPFNLYPKSFRWCVVLAPPINKSLALGAIWPEKGRLKVGIWHGEWPKHLGIAKEDVNAKLGSALWRYVDASNVDEFIQNLEQLLAR